VTKHRLVFSDAAIADVLEQADWYLQQSGRPRPALGKGSHISNRARNSTSRRRARMRLPIARTQRRAAGNHPKFPKHLLFYRFNENEKEVFVLRIVHGARDLERLFS
jgi:plasmid stabilization system protein ParE